MHFLTSPEILTACQVPGILWGQQGANKEPLLSLAPFPWPAAAQGRAGLKLEGEREPQAPWPCSLTGGYSQSLGGETEGRGGGAP